mmetsp:Transcript_1127/g.2661  ORF Transcript_1127/g.2661 Transcript_1127/m.2661 type:complete len:164 (-) Transcript_1127:147-638(-)
MARPNSLGKTTLGAVFLLFEVAPSLAWSPRRLFNLQNARIRTRSCEVEVVLSLFKEDWGEPEGALPENDLNEYITRLETLFREGTPGPGQSTDALQESKDRVKLDNWIEREGFCVDGNCDDDAEQCAIPEDLQNSGPNVDVMEFLGIRRAEPVKRVSKVRDWD